MITLRQAMPAIRTLARELSLAPLATSCTCGHVSIAHGVLGLGACHGRVKHRRCSCQRFVGWYPNKARDFERFGKLLVKRLQTQPRRRVTRKSKKSGKGY